MSVPGFPGELLETWDPVRVLGQGAMGRVFLARHRREGFEGAIKVTLAPDSPNHRARMVQEARALAGLRHPHVVCVFDGGLLPSGEAFVAMERLQGHSLDEGGPRDPRRFFAEITSALGEVHRAGLVHRDVKPANLFETEDGRAVLVDFGLVLLPNKTRLTATGMVAGTPQFMAPEVLHGAAMGPPSDWFSFGVTLYYVLEGRLPFTTEDLGRVLSGAPYPEPGFSTLPPEDLVRGLLVELLRSDPQQRIQDAEAIRAVLAGERAVAPPPAPPEAPSPPAPRLDPSAAPARRAGPLGALFLGTLVAAFLAADGGPAPPAPGTAPPPPPAAPELDLLAETADEWAALEAAGAGRVGDPVAPVNVFPASWRLGDIPGSEVDRVLASMRGDQGERALARWERLANAAASWLGELRRLSRERGDASETWRDPRVRGRWLEQVAPTLVGPLDDHTILWARLREPDDLALPTYVLDYGPALQAFLDACHPLRFALEEWGTPPPAPLFEVWVAIPRELETPGAHGPAVLDAARRGVREASDPVALFWAARALFRVVRMAPWYKELDWHEAYAALRDLRARIDAVPLSPRHRLALVAGAVVELARLARWHGRPRDLGPLVEDLRAGFTILKAEREVDLRISGAGFMQFPHAGAYAGGPLLDQMHPEHPMQAVRSEWNPAIEEASDSMSPEDRPQEALRFFRMVPPPASQSGS